jgi:hypothetical protein
MTKLLMAIHERAQDAGRYRDMYSDSPRPIRGVWDEAAVSGLPQGRGNAGEGARRPRSREASRSHAFDSPLPGEGGEPERPGRRRMDDACQPQGLVFGLGDGGQDLGSDVRTGLQSEEGGHESFHA